MFVVLVVFVFVLVFIFVFIGGLPFQAIGGRLKNRVTLRGQCFPAVSTMQTRRIFVSSWSRRAGGPRPGPAQAATGGE
jgi:hypothetical protein